MPFHESRQWFFLGQKGEHALVIARRGIIGVHLARHIACAQIVLDRLFRHAGFFEMRRDLAADAIRIVSINGFELFGDLANQPPPARRTDTRVRHLAVQMVTEIVRVGAVLADDALLP